MNIAWIIVDQGISGPRLHINNKKVYYQDLIQREEYKKDLYHKIFEILYILNL